MRPMKLAVAAAIGATMLLVASTVLATTYLDTGFGTPLGGGSARSLAMGSTGVSLRQGSDALFFNPAALLPESGRGDVDLALSISQANEDRLVPLFDSFSSFLDETIVALNRNTYGDVHGGGTWRIPGAHPMAISAGVFDRFDFDYDYFEEFRDPNGRSDPRDLILQNRQINVAGRLRSISVGYAAEVVQRVQVGASVHRYTGDVERSIRVDRLLVPNVQTARRTLDRVGQSLDGWGWSVGAWGRPNERVDLGVSFEGPFKVDGTGTTTLLRGTGTQPDTLTVASADRKVDYPGTLRCGVTYHPRNELKTTFSVEMERRFWSSLETRPADAFGDSVDVRDTWELRVGLEHVFYNGLPLRFGFRYLENYADPESERAIFSAGIGYDFAGFDVGLTGLFHRQTSRQAFLFDPSYGTFQAPNSLEKVEDSVLQLVVGASRSF